MENSEKVKRWRVRDVNDSVGLEVVPASAYDILATQVRTLREERDKAEDALRHHGYRKTCDIPACNCGDQWLHGGNASMRLMEIADELGERTQGKTMLQAIKELEQSLVTAREETEKLRAELFLWPLQCVEREDAAYERVAELMQRAGDNSAAAAIRLAFARALKPTTEAGGGETK